MWLGRLCRCYCLFCTAFGVFIKRCRNEAEIFISAAISALRTFRSIEAIAASE
jgi:hypothetical protein